MAVLRAISHRSLGPRRGARGQPADRQEGEADADGGDSDKPGNAPELTLERSPFAVLTLSVSAAIRPGSVCVPVVCARLLRPSAQVSARPWLVVGSRARARDAVDLYLRRDDAELDLADAVADVPSFAYRAGVSGPPSSCGLRRRTALEVGPDVSCQSFPTCVGWPQLVAARTRVAVGVRVVAVILLSGCSGERTSHSRLDSRRSEDR